MLTNRPTATIRTSSSHRLSSMRLADDQKYDVADQDHNHYRAHRQTSLGKTDDSTRHASRSATSSVESRQYQQEGEHEQGAIYARDQKERTRERDNHHHRHHYHSSRHDRSSSRQRSRESSAHRHHHSRPLPNEDDKSREAPRYTLGHERHERNSSPFRRSLTRYTAAEEEDDLANISIRTNPGKKDGSGLLTIRDILDNPDLQIKGSAKNIGVRGAEQQRQQGQQRRRSPISNEDTQRDAGTIKGNGKAAPGANKRLQEPPASDYVPRQHQRRTKSSSKPKEAAGVSEEGRQEQSIATTDASIDQSAMEQYFREHLDAALRYARKKNAGEANGASGSRDTRLKLQASNYTKNWAINASELTVDDSVYSASVDEEDDDTDATQKTAEHIPSLIRSNQVNNAPRARHPLTNTTLAVSKQIKDNSIQPGHTQYQSETLNQGHGDEHHSDDPGYDTADSFERETALARARREQAKEQQLRASQSKPTLLHEKSNYTGANLLSAPNPTSKTKGRSSATSASKSPLVSPRLTGMENGVVNSHRALLSRSLRKDIQQQQPSASTGSPVVASLSIPTTLPTTTTTTTSMNTRRKAILDHGRDLALEDLASPTGQDPFLVGGLGGRRGSKKPTLLTAEEDDRYPRPSIMSSYLRLSDTMQTHRYTETENRFLELAGSIGEGQAVSTVFGTLKDKIRTLKQKQKSSTSTIKGLQKELKRAQRELARERRQKDALSASLSALSSAAPLSQGHQHNGTKVEHDIESLQQRIEALERERDLAATKKDKLIQQRQKELLFLDTDSSEDEDDLDIDDGSNTDSEEESEEQGESLRPVKLRQAPISALLTRPPHRDEDMPPLAATESTAGSLHGKRRDSSIEISTKDSVSQPGISASSSSATMASPLHSNDSRQQVVGQTCPQPKSSTESLKAGQQKAKATFDEQHNVVRFEVPLPTNMRASQVVYLPSFPQSLSALLSSGSGSGGNGISITAKDATPVIFSAPETAAATTIAALSSPSPFIPQNQEELKEVHIHHHVHYTDNEHGKSGSSKDGKEPKRSDKTSSSRWRTQSKSATSPTAIKAIDMLRRSIGHRESYDRSSVGAAEPGSEVVENEFPEFQSEQQQQLYHSCEHTEQNPDRRNATLAPTACQDTKGDEHSSQAAVDQGVDVEEQELIGDNEHSEEHFDVYEQSMIDSDTEGQPRRIQIDMNRVMSLLKAHHPERCTVCCSQPSRTSEAYSGDRGSSHHESRKRQQNPISSMDKDQFTATKQQEEQEQQPTSVADRCREDAEAIPLDEQESSHIQAQEQHQLHGEDDDDVEDRFHKGLLQLENDFRDLHNLYQELHDEHEQFKRSRQADSQTLAAHEERKKAIDHQLLQVEQLIKAKAQEILDLRQTTAG